MEGAFETVLNKNLQADVESMTCEHATAKWSDIAFLKQLDESSRGVSHFVDIVEGVDGPIATQMIAESLTNQTEGKLDQQIQNLPSPFGMKVFTPKITEMQMAIIQEGDANKYTVFKHYHFPSKVTSPQIKRIAHGEIRVMQWGEEGHLTAPRPQITSSHSRPHLGRWKSAVGERRMSNVKSVKSFAPVTGEGVNNKARV